jgi:predicted Zn-dependent peptidase
MILRTQVSRLPNGLRVVSATMPHAQSVSVGVWVGAGGRCEPPAWAGISHFIEHMLFKGTRRRSARQISETIEGRGGDINAFTQEESTCYFARVACDRAWEALDVLLDMYAEPRLGAEDIRRERSVVMEEIMMVRDQPAHHVEEMIGELLWPGQALGRPLVGRPETIRTLGRPAMVEYMRRAYVPANTVIAFAGPVDHAACVRQARRHVGDYASGRRLRFAPVDGQKEQHPLRFMGKDTEQAHVTLGIRAFGRNDCRRYALKVLSVMLGENMSSRLFQVVREKHGLAYAIQSGVHLHHDTGALIVSAGLDSKRIEQAMLLIARELGRLRDRPAGRCELARARDYAVGQIRMSLESTSAQMMWAGEHLLCHGEIITPESIIEALRVVTADEVQTLARQLFRSAGMSLAVIAPDTEKDGERRMSAVMKQM